MKEKVVTTYVAEDGKEFGVKDECEKYEDELRASLMYKPFKVNDKEITKEDIIGFLKLQNCSTCVFKEECDNLYSFTRARSTTTTSICEVMMNDLKDYIYK